MAEVNRALLMLVRVVFAAGDIFQTCSIVMQSILLPLHALGLSFTVPLQLLAKLYRF